MAMNDEDFWDDLLGHIRHQMLVPVIGPDLTAAKVGDADQTFNTLICRRLAERYQLNVSPAVTTMGEAVAAVLRERGRDELDRLYGPIERASPQSRFARRSRLRSLPYPRIWVRRHPAIP